MTVMAPVDVLDFRRLLGNQLERLHIAADTGGTGRTGSQSHYGSRETNTHHCLHEASLLGCERRFDAK